MTASNAIELEVLDYLLGADTTPSPPATVWIALYSAAPTDAGGGTELTGGGYARVSKTNNLTNWPSANPKVNGTDIDFGTISADVGTATHWGIHRHATNDDLMFWGALDDPRLIKAGDTVKFPAGSLSITGD